MVPPICPIAGKILVIDTVSQNKSIIINNHEVLTYILKNRFYRVLVVTPRGLPSETKF